MARKKKDVATNEDFNDMMGALLKGTDKSSLVSDSAMMHDRPKVETPIPELNAFLAGGLPLGCMIECYGDPSAGKSSFAYQTLGNFQHMYPDGIGLIVDTEASVDRTRMAYMGANDEQTIRVSSDTIEVGFSEVFKILDNKLNNKDLKDKPMFILWDTISLASTEKQFENKESMNGGGMMELPRILKRQLTNMIPYIEKMPILVVLLNQVTTEMTRFGSKLNSAGGWGIKHNVQLRLQFKSGKTEYDNVWAKNKSTTLDMVKSKLSPLMENMSITIDITKGGVIDPVKSILNYSVNNGFPYISMPKNGWWSTADLANRFPEFVGKFDKFLSYDTNFRIKEFNAYVDEHPDLAKLVEIALIDDMSKVYSYQGELAKPYRDRLYNEVVSSVGVNEVENNQSDEAPEGVDPDTGEIKDEINKDEDSNDNQ